MKKTVVISLFGSPGSGKSTIAADVFSALKKTLPRGKTVEVILHEHAKLMNWMNLPIASGLQKTLYFQQLLLETQLCGQVDFLVTDSPTMTCAFYDMHYKTGNGWVETIEGLKRQRVESVDYFLPPARVYDENGRWESQEESVEISNSMITYFNTREFIARDRNFLMQLDGQETAAETIVTRLGGLSG